MIKPKVNTDEVVTNTKKALYDLREVDHSAMSDKQKEDFEKELSDLERLAKSILGKIK